MNERENIPITTGPEDEIEELGKLAQEYRSRGIKALIDGMADSVSGMAEDFSPAARKALREILENDIKTAMDRVDKAGVK